VVDLRDQRNQGDFGAKGVGGMAGATGQPVQPDQSSQPVYPETGPAEQVPEERLAVFREVIERLNLDDLGGK
jgi:hypothetical protein